MFWKNFYCLCEKNGIKPLHVVSELGIAAGSITKWKNGTIPSTKNIQKIANYFHVEAEYFFVDHDHSANKKEILRIPVYGQVAAGIPIEAIEDIDDYEEVDASTVPHGEYMALRIKGHSMEPKMSEGDVVIVHLQDDVNTGDIAVVLVNGGEATCKKIKKTPDGVILISTNPDYEPMFFSNQDIVELPVRILGKVVELRCKFK